jgi:hypothetical protein
VNAAVAPRLVRVKLDQAGNQVVQAIAGRGLFPLSVPAAAKLSVRLNETTADPFQLDQVGGVEWCSSSFERFYLSWQAVAGGELVLLVIDGDTQVTPKGGGGGVRALYQTAPTAAADGAETWLATDSSGRLYVRLGDRLASDLDSIEVRTPAAAYVNQAWTGGANTAGVRASLVLDGRRGFGAWASLAGAGTVRLEGSADGGATWRTLDTVVLASAGEVVFDRSSIAWPQLSVYVPTTAIAVTCTLVAR